MEMIPQLQASANMAPVIPETHINGSMKELGIRDFYQGRSLFVTGCTGFIGKVVLEKLLRDVPGIEKIYILCRRKKGLDPQARVDKMMEADVFSLASEMHPHCTKKVIAVPGDMLQPGLGICNKDREELIDNVSVILHIAATIKFTEEIKTAAAMNISGPMEIIKLARELKNLASVVHTSTAYTHTYRSDIPDNKFLKPTYDTQKLLDMLENSTTEVANAATPALIKGHPNTYTFTKCCAESVIHAAHEEGMPITVVRPSIVLPAWKEPYEGWTDTLNGTPGLMLAAGTGMFRVVPGNKSCRCNIVPVDVVANYIIAAGWHTHMRKVHTGCPKYALSAPIVNATTQSDYTWGDFVRQVNASWLRYPIDKKRALRRPSLTMFSLGGTKQPNNSLRSWLYFYWNMVSEHIPGRILDMLAMAQGHQAFSQQLFSRVQTALKDYEFFLTHEFKWSYENNVLISKAISDEEKEIFYWDTENLHWDEYIQSIICGIKKFKLKESVEHKAVEDGRRMYKSMARRDILMRFVTAAALTRLAATIGIIRRSRLYQQSTWVLVFLCAYFSSNLRKWLNDME